MKPYFRSSFYSLVLHATAVLGVFLSCRPIVPSPEASKIRLSDYLFITAVNIGSEDIESKTASSSPKTKIEEPVPAPGLPDKQIDQQLEGVPKLAEHKKIIKRRKIDRRRDGVSDDGLKNIARQRMEAELLPAAQSSGASTKEPVTRSDNTAVQTDKNQLSMSNGKAVGVGPANSEEVVYVRMNYEYIRRIIISNLSFPDSARKRQLSGRIEVSFLVGKDGRVDDVHLDISSGHALLDMNVVTAIHRSAPFPAPPEKARITLPIVFRLK